MPGALHTPLVQGAQEPLRVALANEDLTPPTKLFYSSVTSGRASAPDEFVANLVAQLVEPLDYPALIQRLVRDGVGALVEIGPGSVLTRLHRAIVGPDVVCSETDHPRRSAWEQLESARAALECIGAVAPHASSSETRRVIPGRIAEFDATTARRLKRRSQAEAAKPAQLHADSGQPVADSPLTHLLLDYVVDLTGYPRAAISLDWDLEADLGLDSIKRAQLVGELSEALDLSTNGDAGAALGDLHTLRQIVGYLEDSATRANRPEPHRDTREADRVSGAYRKGLEQGMRQATSVREVLRLEAMSASASAPVTSAADVTARLSERDQAELQGLADGAGVHVGNVIAYRLRRGINPAHTRETGAQATQVVPSHDGPLSRRYVMRMVELAHPEDVVGRRLAGTALVVGDGAVSQRLRGRLDEQGVPVHVMDQSSPESAVAELERLWRKGPIVHLFLAAGHDQEASDELDTEAWQERRARVLMTPFSLLQRWLGLLKDAELMDEATLVGLTELGGDLGFSGQLRSFESAALTGLFKAILIESWVQGFRHLPVKIVDAPTSESPDSIVDAVLRELAVPSYESEVGLQQGTRTVVRPVRDDLPPPAPGLDLGKSWVCTGGARGITAFVAGELARRFDLRLHLIGCAPRSDVPQNWLALWPNRKREFQVKVMESAHGAGESPVKAWETAQKSLEIEETLSKLEAMDVTAAYHSCDISDRTALERVLAAIRSEGPIHGILHGAGSSRDAKFEQKEPHRVEQCFRAKVDGTLALMDLTRGDALKHFVAFGSVSGRFGANGHADYSAANDMMAKLVDWYRGKRPEVGAVTFHWHAWGDVGMATKAETQLGLQLVDMRFMPASEGVEHLIREIQAGVPEAEVLITDPRYHARFYSQEVSHGGGSRNGRPPLLGSSAPEQRGEKRVHSISLDPDKEIFLKDHRLDGRPLLPLAVGLEMVSEAVLGETNGPIRLRSIETLHGLGFQGSGAKTVRVEAGPAEESQTPCALVADFRARDGTLLEADRPILRAIVDGPGAPAGRPASRKGDEPDGPWRRVKYASAQSRFYHGPALQALRRTCFENGDMWGVITAPTVVELAGSQRASSGWKIHCAVLDACLYAVGFMAWTIEPDPSIPLAMEELWVGRFPAPREDCLVRVTPRGRKDRRGHFDFTVYGANGEPLMEARGYTISWLSPRAPATP